MKIINAEWTAKHNLIKILCDCGNIFYNRADRKKVMCPRCKRIEDTQHIRDEIKPDSVGAKGGPYEADTRPKGEEDGAGRRET